MLANRILMRPSAKKEKEQAIFWAACKVIREKGYNQARMADIANEAGISYGLVYHYYKNKSELFDALIKEWWSGLDALTDRLLSESIPVEQKLGAIVDYFLEQYDERPDLVHIFITELSRSTVNLTDEHLKKFKNLMSRTEKIIKSAQLDGTLRDDLKPRYLTFFFLGALEALLSTMVLEDQSIKSNTHKLRLTDAILTMFLEGARPGKAVTS